MGLAEDLLAQAKLLAELDPRRPKQANLRRAASSAYYALFHLLIAEAVQRMVPAQPRGLMDRVSRAFSHGEMKQACVLFRADPTGPKLLYLLGTPTTVSLRSIAASFVTLQELRHTADYDPGIRFSRVDVLATIARTEAIFSSWNSLRKNDEANVFLAALAFGARWDR